VAASDAVLGAEAGGYESMRDAIDGERGQRQGIDIGIWTEQMYVVCPGRLVQVDQVNRPATNQERVAVGEGRSWPDEDAGPERGVHLVPARGEVVS
jgi:hypothetical protein